MPYGRLPLGFPKAKREVHQRHTQIISMDSHSASDVRRGPTILDGIPPSEFLHGRSHLQAPGSLRTTWQPPGRRSLQTRLVFALWAFKGMPKGGNLILFWVKLPPLGIVNYHDDIYGPEVHEVGSHVVSCMLYIQVNA